MADARHARSGARPPGDPGGGRRGELHAGGILLVRPSSLGDIVYAMAIVSDLAAHCPQVPVDWVAEEAFVPLVRLDPRVRHVIPLGLRIDRKSTRLNSSH